jgi:hypothetical protein
MERENDPLREENRRIRLFRVSSDLVIQMLMSRSVVLSEAESMIDGMRRLARDLFPDKEHVFDLIYMPRFRRVLREAGYLSTQPALKVLQGQETP